LEHGLSVRLVGRPADVESAAERLLAAGFHVTRRDEIVDAVVVVWPPGAKGRWARELVPSSSHVPVVVTGLARDPELLRQLFRAGTDECVFLDESAQLPQRILDAVRIGHAYRLAEAGHDETLQALILALDTREQETAGHSHRVALWTLFFGMVVGVPESRLHALHRGALLHDLGKIGIPDPILLKRGELTPEEWTIMRNHPRIGRDVLWKIERLREVAEIPYSHHERWDGSGYPCGLAGSSIPLPARLFAIVDVYDALRSTRPYKSALSHEESLMILQRSNGSHFDPELCVRFVALPESVWQELTAPNLESMTFVEVYRLARRVARRLQYVEGPAA
jgi:hypothetical protein